MKNAFLYFPFLLLFFVLGCGDGGSGIVDPPMTEEPEPTSLRTGLLFHVPFNGNADDIAVGGLTGVVSGATITTDRHGEANLTVYRNGELDATIPFPRHDHDRTTEVLIGGVFSQNNVLPSFKGTIDDVRIYNRVLTADELTWLATH